MSKPAPDLRVVDGTAPAGPSNVEAEQALLGCLLYDNAAHATPGGYLQGRHFAEPFHQRLFADIEAEIRKGHLAEPILLADQFARDPAFEELGGIHYLADLVDKAPPVANAADYARVIFEASVRRDLLQVCAQASRSVLQGDPTISAFDLTAELRAKIEQIEHAATPDDATMIDAPEAAANAIAAMQELAAHGRPRGCMTGLRCIDYRLNGLKPGAMIVIGGRPGMCKTGLARAMAHGAAIRNPTKLFHFMGIEMGPEEMMQRELSALTHVHGDGVEYRAMGSGSLTAMDLMDIDAAAKHVPPNLILDDCVTLSVEDVRRKVWTLGRRGTVGAVFIDYLQLMRRPLSDGRNEASVLAEMTGALKRIARQAGITVVLLSQLNRSVESRDDKKPMLSDLRESGSIEQDADAVLFPYREFYYVQRAEPKDSDVVKHREWEIRCEDLRRRLDVICGKQRQGPEGTDRQRYFAEFDFIEDEHDRA